MLELMHACIHVYNIIGLDNVYNIISGLRIFPDMQRTIPITVIL